MNRSTKVVVSAVFLAAMIVLPQPVAGQHPANKRGQTCLPPFWGGVLAGSTRLEAVERLFGRAVATEVQGSDARVYIDGSQSRTVVIKFFDRVVTSLDVWGSAAAPPGVRVSALTSDWIKAQEGIGVWAELNVGTAGTASVRKNMGEPQAVSRRDDLLIWTYQSSCACELASGLTFRFRGEQLVSFGVWSNEG